MKHFAPIATFVLLCNLTPGVAQIQQSPQVPYDSLLSAYFANFVCGDGSLPAVNPGCGWLNAQKASDPIRWQRADWGSNGAPWYYVSDSVVSDNGQYILQPWLASHQAPYFNPPNDGGQVIVTDGLFFRFALSEDGGHPREYFFTGPGCGGTGWIIMDVRRGLADAPAWSTEMAILGNTTGQTDTTNEFLCPSNSQALTRWQDAQVLMPWRYFAGPIQWVWAPMMISEHYATADPTSAPQMERFFFAYHYGEVLWEYWARTPPRPDNDLLQRCLGYGIRNEFNGGWYQPTGGTWYLNDCRQYTQVISAPGGTYNQLGWPNPAPAYR